MTENLKNADLKIYRRRLPHWRLEGSIYFITWRLKPGQPPLLPQERDLIKTAVNFHHRGKYIISAYVVMDDHVHLLIQLKGDRSLSQIIGELKSYTSRMMKNQYGRETPVWQDEFFDRIVRDEAEFLQKAGYILSNPLRRWPEQTEYDWVGIPD